MKAISFPAVMIFGLFSLIQAGQNVRMSVQPSSVLVLKGTSTFHDFECKTTTIHGTIEIDPASESFTTVDMVIPVKSIHSESSSMDDNMYEALKADENPDIKFSFLHYDTTAELKPLSKDSTFRIIGRLTVAGKERPSDLDIVVVKKGNGIYTVSGKKKLLMTDFGVKPPTFMFGIMKTGNEIVIEFNIELKDTGVSNQTSIQN